MTAYENERNPDQQPPGYKPEQRDHEGEQNAYGQDKDATNLNRDRQHTNAANQSNQQAHPDSANQNREGQHPNEKNKKNPPYPSTGNQDGRRNEDDPNGMKNVDKVIPEVPNREEKRERKTPQAGKTETNNSDRNSTNKGTIDDSSKFSE